nr:hypothetical protein [Tanacetum cinerariifolium]
MKIVTDAVDWAIQASPRNRFRDLPEAGMKEILHQRMWETNSYKAHEDHMMLYEALEKSMNRKHTDELLKDLAKARKKKKKRRDSPKTPPGSPPHQPPPPPLPAGPSGTSGAPGASGSSQTVASAEYKAWTTTNTRLRLSVFSTPEDLHMDDDMAPDVQPLEEDRLATPEPAWSIPSFDPPVPKNNWASALASTYSPPPEDSLLAQTGDMAMFMDWFCKRQGITKIKPRDLEGPAFELVKVFHPNVIHLQYQMQKCHKLLTDSMDDSIIRHNVSKPLPVGGPPGQVTIQSDFFFNKDLEYLRYGGKMWIEEECKYDITAMYGISQWWFQRQRFYVDRHTSEGDHRAVRTHMRILSVVRIEVFSTYGYDYINKIILRRADLNEHIIADRDFKYMYPSDFEDLYLLNLQDHLNHLPPKDKKILTTAVNLWTTHLVIRQRVKDFQLGIESYQTHLNLTKPRWDATGLEYKHDYTVLNSPRSVTFRDKYGVQMIMRFNEIHKFSDDTLHQIDEALNYRVKEFKVNRMNPGLNTRFWTRKDVDRSKEFMFAIQKRLKTRRIFCNLESFVGGRVRDEDYRLLKHPCLSFHITFAMSTQQDIYAAGSENRPPMLNKENYVSWSSHLLRYAKSRPNGKLIHNSVINGPYVRRMILEPGDTNREVSVNEIFHVQTDDELTEKELKQIEDDDQAIQTILLGHPGDIYAAVDSCETAQEVWLRVQQMMKGFDIGIQEKKAKLFDEWERFTSNDGESIESYYHRFLKLMNDLKRNKHFPEKIASNLKFLNNLQTKWSRHVTIVHQTKYLHTANYTQLYDFLKYNQNEVD